MNSTGKQQGVYTAQKKDGTLYYRVSLTYRRKHISLGSYPTQEVASSAYQKGREILDSPDITLDSYTQYAPLSHNKYITLINFRDNGIYFPTPIYLRKQYFEYYLTEKQILKFDRDDLFFYASHHIQQKGGYLFVSDYGSQYSILGRYGIHPFAVYNRDYIMMNGDTNDYRYENIRVINNYIGVQQELCENGKTVYHAQIHIRGNYHIGTYDTETDAAIAYNKAVDQLKKNGFKKAHSKNYIISMDKAQYESAYQSIKISKKITALVP